MRVVHVNTTEAEGGAARSASRLHHALRECGVDSLLLVHTRFSDAPDVVRPASPLARAFGGVLPYVDQVPARAYHHRTGPFSTGFVPGPAAAEVRSLRPTIVNLHWVNNGFLAPRQVGKLYAPVVWTLHDSWAFTGGCHVPPDCMEYERACGRCRALNSRGVRDLSRIGWINKRTAWKRVGIVAVAPSVWMRDRARRSALLRDREVIHIPNGVDTRLFRPIPRDSARSVLAIRPEERVILFGAMYGSKDRNKGFDLLWPALLRVASDTSRHTTLLVTGASEIPDWNDARITVRCIGPIRDELSMVVANAASDVVAVPSRLENFPNAVLEAFGCARPVVAFDVGGVGELIEDGVTGRLIAPFDTHAFAAALRWAAEPRNHAACGARARAVAEGTFSLELQAAAYQRLYQRLLSERGVTEMNTVSEGVP